MAKRRPKISIAATVIGNINGNLWELEEFKYFLISAIEREKRRTDEAYKKATKGRTQEEIEYISESFVDQHFFTEKIFPKLTRYSFVVILYSFIEDSIQSLCDAERQDRNIKLRYTDMKGKGIERAKIYLTKVVELELHLTDDPWQEIVALKNIRNCIVHKDGWSDDQFHKNSRIKEHIKMKRINLKTFSREKYGKIIIEDEYMDYILDQVKVFFQNIRDNKIKK